jgi:hypothetical protein
MACASSAGPPGLLAGGRASARRPLSVLGGSPDGRLRDYRKPSGWGPTGATATTRPGCAGRDAGPAEAAGTGSGHLPAGRSVTCAAAPAATWRHRLDAGDRGGWGAQVRGVGGEPVLISLPGIRPPRAATVPATAARVRHLPGAGRESRRRAVRLEASLLQAADPVVCRQDDHREGRDGTLSGTEHPGRGGPRAVGVPGRPASITGCPASGAGMGAGSPSASGEGRAPASGPAPRSTARRVPEAAGSRSSGWRLRPVTGVRAATARRRTVMGRELRGPAFRFGGGRRVGEDQQRTREHRSRRATNGEARISDQRCVSLISPLL